MLLQKIMHLYIASGEFFGKCEYDILRVIALTHLVVLLTCSCIHCTGYIIVVLLACVVTVG